MVKRNALGQSVVASELAKSKGKLSSVAKIVGVAILGLSSSAFAETFTNEELSNYPISGNRENGGGNLGYSYNNLFLDNVKNAKWLTVEAGNPYVIDYASKTIEDKWLSWLLNGETKENYLAGTYWYKYIAENHWINNVAVTDSGQWKTNQKYNQKEHDFLSGASYDSYYLKKQDDIKLDKTIIQAHTSENPYGLGAVVVWDKLENFKDIDLNQLSDEEKNKIGLLGHLNRDTYKITETNLDQVTGNVYFSSKQLNPKYTDIITNMISNSPIQSDSKSISDAGKMLSYLADTKQEIRLGLENDEYGIKKDEFSQAGLSLMKHYITDNAYNKDWSESDKTLYGLNKLIYQEVKDGREKQVYLGIDGMNNGGNKIENVGKGEVSLDSTDAVNGSQLYAVTEAINAIQTINLDDIADVITTEVNITGGDNVQVNREGNNFTISATNTQSVMKAGNGVTVDVADNDIGTKDYTVSTKIGDGLTFGDNGEIKATGTIINAGDNITVTGDALNGYTISTKGGVTDEQLQDVINQINGIVDTNTQSTTSAGQGIIVTETDNANGTKNYAVSIKATDGLTFDDNGNIKVSDTLVKAGENVQVSGNAKGGYTISATDTNTQATVSADKGITITETNNANGTKNYAVSAKLGKGLKVDENGAIAATAQPINGGAGVTITTNAQDEAVVNVAGVTTTTDDGKSYTRSDLTKPVGVKGDGKNIRTSTAANGDVQVKLADDVKVNSVTTGNVSISTKGVNAGGKKVTNVAPAEISSTSTDAVNGSQLHATNIQVHNNTQNIAKLGDRVNHLDTKVNKVNKEARAGIAGTVATASLPQVYIAGKSMVSAAGHYKNENAVAVGYSKSSDDGKLIFKLNSSANTRGDFTVGTGVGYQW